MKPVIGITPTAQIDALTHGTFRRYVLSAPYIRAVEAAGGVPLILPPLQEDVETLCNLIDGLLLSGGTDVDPARYGDEYVHAETYGIDPERDQFELSLFNTVLSRDIPVFGICRGIQVMNVALGGTLIQDVASEHPGAASIGHRQHDRGLEVWEIGHQVLATNADLLPIFDNGELGVNSFHHQAIKRLASDLAPVAHSIDGLVEAVVMPNHAGVFGVQWHPELMFDVHPAHLRPFERLVDAARTRRLVAASR